VTLDQRFESARRFSQSEKAKALPKALAPKDCRDEINEERHATRQGTFPRVFSGDDGGGRATAPDRVIDELKAYDFEIISTNLPEQQQQKLREAFAQEQ
jgi:hypothetical protein